jgi:hypothetical protein
MTVTSLCVHWWMIGEYSVGQCKKCGATRDFAQKQREAEQAKTFHRGKPKK